MSNITRREFFRLASLVGGVVIFDIEAKRPFAKLLAEKIMRHPAARSVAAAYSPCFRYDIVCLRVVYWSEKWQQRLIQLYEIPQEVYESPGGEDSDLEAEIVAITLGRCADYELKHGPHSRVVGGLPAGTIFGTGSGGEPIELL